MQLVPQGTIVLIVKRNNCKNHCQKQPQGLFFEKIVPQTQLQIYRGNAQQVAFTPIKFQSNHIEVRFIIVCLSTELQDLKTIFPKKTNPEKLLTNEYISSHTISK